MKIKVQDMILIALFAALTAIGAFIKIPTPIVPFTLQYLFCAYSGLFLGARYGLYSQLLYVGLGLIGVPVFTNGGGLTYIFQPTFGYLIGFILCAYIVGKFTERLEEVSLWRILGPVLLGLSAVYICGVVHLYLILNLYLGKPISVPGVIAVGFLPYIGPDLILSGLVAVSATRIVPVMRKSGFMKTWKEKVS